jgi:epoxyqueuosine reductase
MTKSNLISKELLEEIGAIDFAYTEDPHATTFDIYSSWVKDGHHGPLGYLSDERKEKRKSLKEVYPSFESALVFIFPYINEKKLLSQMESELKMASYAFAFDGEDYHFVLKEKMAMVLDSLRGQGIKCEGLDAIDTKPILERDLAMRAGLGWVGKNSMLINREYGSYFMIASLLLDTKLDLELKELEVDHCGNCTKCIDACPTDCILDNRTIEASKCISTFTIEMFKDCDAPVGFEQADYFFGCDICQDVCPWNKKPLDEVELLESASERQSFFNEFFLSKDKNQIVEKLESMSNKEYQRVFKGTSLQRTGRVGLLKNLKKL